MVLPWSKLSNFLLLDSEEKQFRMSCRELHDLTSAFFNFVQFLFMTSFWTKQTLSCLWTFASARTSTCDIPPLLRSVSSYRLSRCWAIASTGMPSLSILFKLASPFLSQSLPMILYSLCHCQMMHCSSPSARISAA